MSIASRIRDWLSPTYQVSFNVPDIVERIQGQSPAELYETQPHLRTVISFIADNVAQVALKEYQRASDTDRRRVTDDTLIKLLQHPNTDVTGFELIRQLASDLCLYDTAYWLVARDADAETGWSIRPIPPAWVTSVRGGTVFAPGSYHVDNQRGSVLDIPASSMLVFHGYNPVDPASGSSAVRALKDVINEQIQAWSYRTQVWQRGGRIGAVLVRPKDAPRWSDEDRNRFRRSWQEFKNHGERAGDTPLLEDGMTLQRVGFSAREDQFEEVTKLSLSTVASVYHVSPVMVGILDNANYSNTKEFRKMLYGQTLGPLLKMIEQRLNSNLAPILGTDPDNYLEFDVRAKLSGDFEEQASVLSTSVGAPWITPNEARATQNLPSLPGGDTLVTPLNVTKGGQASPQDGGSVPTSPAEQAKAFVPLPDNEEILDKWYQRVSRSIKSRTGAGGTIGIDKLNKWRGELFTDLVKNGNPRQLADSISLKVTTEIQRRLNENAEQIF